MNIILNPDPEIEVTPVGDIDILIVDNFLINPDELRQYGIDSYKAYTKGVDTENYLFRETKKTYEVHPRPKLFNERFPGLIENIAFLIDRYLGPRLYDYHSIDPAKEKIQLRKGPYFHGVHQPPIYLPHVDDGHVSSFMYLNPDDMCWGGTGVYRHIPTDRVAINQTGVDLEPICRTPLLKNLTVSTPEWKLEKLVEMKYNRFVAFNSSTIHKIYWPDSQSPYKRPVRKSRFTLNNFFKYA